MRIGRRVLLAALAAVAAAWPFRQGAPDAVEDVHVARRGPDWWWRLDASDRGSGPTRWCRLTRTAGCRSGFATLSPICSTVAVQRPDLDDVPAAFALRSKARALETRWSRSGSNLHRRLRLHGEHAGLPRPTARRWS